MLAIQKNFVQGRKTANVVAACLYIVCRREKSPHLLIDFSDVLQTNVYVLGNCFLKFSRLLSLKLPIIDPSLYIHRFASKLEFGDKAHEVSMTALRLVARMKVLWVVRTYSGQAVLHYNASAARTCPAGLDSNGAAALGHLRGRPPDRGAAARLQAVAEGGDPGCANLR